MLKEEGKGKIDMKDILMIFYLPLGHKECALVFVSPHAIQYIQNLAQCTKHNRHNEMLRNHKTVHG